MVLALIIQLILMPLGKTNLIHQAVYVCHTCGGEEDGKCCCAGCVAVCHADHETDFLGYGRAFCDCGAMNCALAVASEAIAIKALLSSSSPNIGQDADGRLSGTSSSNLIINPCQSIEMVVSPQLELSASHFLQSNDSIASPDTVSDVFKSLESLSITLASHSKQTFWFGAKDTPRCSFELLALKIFNRHVPTQAVVYDGNSTGVEWWVQVKKTNMGNNSSSNSSSSSSSLRNQSNDATSSFEMGGIDLHYDKDEELAEVFGVGVFPQISTVTYLSDTEYAAPTLVLENPASCPVGMPINKCYLSYPKRGKHLNFDGRFLHGAPGQLATNKMDKDMVNEGMGMTSDISKEKGMCSSDCNSSWSWRVTFLVNIWLNHHPSSVERLPDDVCSILQEKEKLYNFTTDKSNAEGRSRTFMEGLDDGVYFEGNNIPGGSADKPIGGINLGALQAPLIPLRALLLPQVVVTKKVTKTDSFGSWELIPFLVRIK